jgi:hypothetical protein
MKISLPISKILNILPYLAPKSTKLSPEKKIELKNMVLNNEIPQIKTRPKSKERKTESIVLFKEMYSSLKSLNDAEIHSFIEIFDNRKLEKLKIAIVNMLRYNVPTEAELISLDEAKKVSSEANLSSLATIFGVMSQAAKKTKTDSKVIQKRIFDPVLLSSFLNKMFFGKI